MLYISLTIAVCIIGAIISEPFRAALFTAESGIVLAIVLIVVLIRGSRA